MSHAKSLVTGAAGFIGSHLCERLISLGHEVIGIDCFTDYYARELKENNIESLLKHDAFRFYEEDLLAIDLKDLLNQVDFVFHQAAQAGVRASWGQHFAIYTRNNILATQNILEAAKRSKIKRFVFASSSSVYGDTKNLPMSEDDVLKPISPYGVSKLAAEHLCYLYWKNFKVPTVSLRYFTVYGPRQRPDMAFNKFIEAMLANKEITIYGDGKQTRDFTYINDAIEANIAAANCDVSGEVFNIGGGSRITLNEVIGILEETIGVKAKTRYIEQQKGDVRHTYSNIDKAEQMLDYRPEIKIEEGLKKEVQWLKKLIKQRYLGAL